MITLELRHAIGRAVTEAVTEGAAEAGDGPGPGEVPDPGLRPGGEPGRYASSVAFGLASSAKGKGAKNDPARIAARLAARLRDTEPWIARAEVTGRGYVTVTVTPEALEQVAERVAAAGPDCVRGDALAGHSCPRPTRAVSWEEAPTWEEARDRLAAELTVRLAEAAGAMITATEGPGGDEPRDGRACHDGGGTGHGGGAMIRSGKRTPAPVTAVAYAGRDAVLLWLARSAPGQPVAVDQEMIARHHPGNPAYAVRYAHARAASEMRWAAAAGSGSAGVAVPAGPR
ncbi:MAG: hypothetical protein J2P25_17430, partial [Nocardiopsaceae bacterium]|nr:hypothetical protein [Nocardiopsaceae bacterium]